MLQSRKVTYTAILSRFTHPAGTDNLIKFVVVI